MVVLIAGPSPWAQGTELSFSERLQMSVCCSQFSPARRFLSFPDCVCVENPFTCSLKPQSMVLVSSFASSQAGEEIDDIQSWPWRRLSFVWAEFFWINFSWFRLVSSPVPFSKLLLAHMPFLLSSSVYQSVSPIHSHFSGVLKEEKRQRSRRDNRALSMASKCNP